MTIAVGAGSGGAATKSTQTTKTKTTSAKATAGKAKPSAKVGKATTTKPKAGAKLVIKSGKAQVRSTIVGATESADGVVALDGAAQPPVGSTGSTASSVAATASGAQTGRSIASATTRTVPRSVATAPTTPTIPPTRTVPTPPKIAAVITPGTWQGNFTLDGTVGAYPVQLDITTVAPVATGGVTFSGIETTFCAEFNVEGSINAAGRAELRETGTITNTCLEIDLTGTYRGTFSATDSLLQMQWVSGKTKIIGGILVLRRI